MKAMQLTSSSTPPQLRLAEMPRPNPGPGEVLIEVYAAGVIPTELLWYPTTHTANGAPRSLPVPGHEFSGVIAALGEGVQGFTLGQEVFGMNDWFEDGATAEFCLTKPEWIAAKPAGITHIAGASIPISALTAWEGLFVKANLQAGERVLVHGGAGAVGLYVVQLARQFGATVIATTSAENASLLTELGVSQIIDYKTTRFEDVAHDVDVVFDTVGGDTLHRSWSVLRAGGRLVTISADAESMTEPRVKESFFIVEPNGQQLNKIARMIEAGDLKTFVKAVVPIEDTQAAYSNALDHTQRNGKVIIRMRPQP